MIKKKMLAAPRAAAQRWRAGRLLRSVDIYVVFAVLGVLAYIIVVNLVAEMLTMDIEDSTRSQLAKIAENGGKAELAAEAYWPYRWPAEALAELPVLRDGMDYATTSLLHLAPLVSHLPAAHLAAWDLLLLANAKTGLTLSAAEMRRVVNAALAQSASTAASVAAAREAVESAAVVWAAKGLTAEVAEAQRIVQDLLSFPTPTLSSVNSSASSWESWSAAVWETVTQAGVRSAMVDVQQAYRHVVDMSRRYWSPAHQGVLLPLVSHHLLPLQSGTYDAVVPLPRLLLHLWVLGGRKDALLAAAYDEAVETILKDLLHTRAVGETGGGGAGNFTFVASSTEHVVPVATPRTCALAGLLSQGVRHGVHRYPTRSPNATYSEEDVLQAAEALASSCFQQYADPDGQRLRSAVYVTSSGPVVGFAAAGDGKGRRSTLCDIPVLLLESFYELYLTTHDPMYGLWSLLVMSDGVSDHCAVSARDLRAGSAEPWLRYVRELRTLWLLLQHMDCLVYRRSRGTRGICGVTVDTLVSPTTGHLRRLPSE